MSPQMNRRIDTILTSTIMHDFLMNLEACEKSYTIYSSTLSNQKAGINYCVGTYYLRGLLSVRV